MRVNREEIFGPVAAVLRADDSEHALALANDTEFGSSAGVVTTSLRHASDFRARAEAGIVMVNLPTAGVDYHVPFGGTKGSASGTREQGRYARGVLHHGEDGVRAAMRACGVDPVRRPRVACRAS